jgi:chaperone modulatory protein CbpM
MDDLGVNAEGVGIVLRLVDQVHGLRSVLAETVAALRTR